MFWAAIRLLLEGNTQALAKLDQIREGFPTAMQQEIEAMWVRKLGLSSSDPELVKELLLMPNGPTGCNAGASASAKAATWARQPRR